MSEVGGRNRKERLMANTLHSGNGKDGQTLPYALFFATALLIGIVLSFGAAVGYVLSETSKGEFLYGHLFKTALIFTLIAAVGGYIKIVGDHFLEDQRTKQAKLDEREAQRKSIIDAFVNTFSGFYSLRKYYESSSRVRGEKFEKYFLVKSTELEGQYGALKIRAIQHFELPAGDFGTQKISDLEAEIAQLDNTLKETKTTINSREAARKAARIAARNAARKRLDLLGEYYDRWRHALEKDRTEILLKPCRERFWMQYTGLLTYFQEDDPIAGYDALLEKEGQDSA
jgi:hypothetical protein